MADYYPLLARALDALPDRTPAMRKAVYERARNALIGQLRSLEPPLSEDDIDLERRALNGAIDRLEADYGGVPAPGNDSAQPTPPPPLPEPLPEPATPPADDAQPDRVLPPASPPRFVPSAEPTPPRPAAIPIGPRKVKAAAALPDPARVEPAASEPAAEPTPDPTNGRQRPRIDVVAPRGGRSRLLRNAFVGIVLVLVIGLIAVAAFLLRDKPAELQANTGEGAGAQQPENNDSKFSDRVGGDTSPGDRPTAPGGVPIPETRGAAAPLPQPDVVVAQRAVLIEENTEAQNAPPALTSGRVTWRLASVSGEQGQPLETAVVATVSYPTVGLSLTMTIQRNLDATLPASHTISLAFAPTGAEGEKRTVQDIGLIQAKDEENGRGSPVSGLPVKVRENLFLIGLSSLRNDIDRNTDLLLHKPWFDLALRYTSGQRAVLTFEKGSSGTQTMQRAFDQWR